MQQAMVDCIKANGECASLPCLSHLTKRQITTKVYTMKKTMNGANGTTKLSMKAKNNKPTVMDSMEGCDTSRGLEAEDDEDDILNPINLATAMGSEGVGCIHSEEFGDKLVLIIKTSKSTKMEFTCVPNALKITVIQKEFPGPDTISAFIGGDVTRDAIMASFSFDTVQDIIIPCSRNLVKGTLKVVKIFEVGSIVDVTHVMVSYEFEKKFEEG